MQTNDLISADDFCTHHHVEFAFIHSLHEYGLVEITRVENAHYIPESELQKIEHLARLHYDLNINLEGIDAITHLLEKLKNIQSEMAILRQRLHLYEGY